MPSPDSTILSLHGVSFAGRHALDFKLGHREVALVEIDDDGDADAFVDLCLGLVEPQRGEVRCLGLSWREQGYREALAHRSRIGTLVGAQTWPAHVPVAQLALVPRLYHAGGKLDDIVVAATALARRFGLAGLPTGGRESVPPGDLARAACVRAFLGMPDFVLIADPMVETLAELGVAMAQAIGAVQDRGGAVLWLVGSMAAPATRFVAADHVLRLGERGFAPAWRPR